MLFGTRAILAHACVHIVGGQQGSVVSNYYKKRIQ